MSAWDHIIGHDWAVDLLANAITNGRIGHAYLFTGAAQVGKTTLATAFAMALNCTETNKPCGACRSCRLIEAGRHPDVTVLNPTISARGKATLKIDEIRTLQRQLQLAVYEGPYKIAIITDFDAATVSAANAFLKTLEEPPKNVILMLTATQADALLDTIKSRCRVVNMRPVATPRLIDHLQTAHQLPTAEATTLAQIANGRPGWAIAAVADSALLEERTALLTMLTDALAGNRVTRFKLAEKLAKQPETLTNLLNIWLTWWRDLLVLANGQTAAVVTNLDYQTELEKLAGNWSAAAILRSLNQTSSAQWQLTRNANTRLVLENLLLTYPFP